VRARGPNGVEWSVRVVWQPRWRSLWRRFRAWRKRHDDPDVDVAEVASSGRGLPGGGGGHGFLDNVGDDFWIVVAVVAFALFAVLAWWVLIPVLLLFLDTIIVAILLAAAIPLRVLFRRPWTVEATLPGERAPAGFAVEVVGWRAARAARDEIADRVRAGLPPAPTGYRSLDAH
jgi:hypothetical protein